MSKNQQVKKSTDKEEIKRLYFEEHLKQTDIAKIFNVSKQAISKILKNDKRMSAEKEYKHNQAVENKKNYNKEYLKGYKRAKSTNIEEYLAMQAMLDKDSVRLSHHPQISDMDFARFNSSIYTIDENGNRILNPDMKSKVTIDVPKFIKAIQVPVLKKHHI
jgi:transcriptional regulator with XRE-family HTH domain